MGNLTLNGATSGQITLAPPAVAGTNTLTLPAATGTVLTTAGGQTISGTTTVTTLNSPAATNLTIQSAGTTAMTIDTSQNVGIGTNSPGAKLEVSSTSNIIQSTGTGGYGAFYAKGSGTNSSYLFLGNGNGEQGRITSENGGAITFSNTSSPTERMRIDSSGRLLVNTTTAAGAANTFCSTAGASQQALSFWNTATSGTRIMCTFGDTGTYSEHGNINWNGTIMTLATTSDRRLKTNIEPANGGLEKVLATNVYSYDMEGGHSEFGVIAQEMIDILPAAVCVGEDNEDGSIKRPWSVGYEPMVPMLIKAIQELKAELDALKGTK